MERLRRAREFVEQQITSAIERSESLKPIDDVSAEFEGLYAPADKALPGGVRAPREQAEWDFAQRIRSNLNTATKSVKSNLDTYVSQFGEQLKSLLAQLLKQSGVRLDEERRRYGLERKAEGPSVSGFFKYLFRSGDSGLYTDSMADTVAGAGLVGAASELKKKRAQVASLKLQNPTSPNATEIRDAEAELLALQTRLRARYPILAAFDEDQGKLGVLAREGAAGEKSGQTETTATLLNAELQKREENIKEVTEKLGTGELNIWSLGDLLKLNLAAQRLAPKSSKAIAVRAKAEGVEMDETLRSVAMGALSLALGVVGTVLTGGTGAVAVAGTVALAGAAGISVAELLRDAEQYETQSAASNTDFDRANAIVKEEPSPFWLALSAAGAIADVSAAVKAVRAIKPLVATAEQATSRVDFENALQKLEQDADPRLAPQVAKKLRTWRKGDFSEAAGAADSLELRAMESASVRLGKGSVLAETKSGKHTYSLLDTGLLKICSSCAAYEQKAHDWIETLETWRDSGLLTPEAFVRYRRRIGGIGYQARIAATKGTEAEQRSVTGVAALTDEFMSTPPIPKMVDDPRLQSYRLRVGLELVTREARTPEEAVQQLLILQGRWRAHHLVAQTLAARSKLVELAIKNGYDINRLQNLMVLPEFRMTDEEFKALQDAFKGVPIPRLPGHRGGHGHYIEELVGAASAAQTRLLTRGKVEGLQTIEEIAQLRPDWIREEMKNLEATARALVRKTGATDEVLP